METEDVYQKLTEKIKSITSKQYKIINENTVKELENIVGNTDTHLRRAYQLVLEYLKKPHSEIRYNAFFILNIFFKNYLAFRRLVIDDLKYILELTVDLEFDSPLPPPKGAANDLKRLGLQSVKEWVGAFGKSHRKLKICYEFLVRKKKVDFVKLEMESEAERARKEQEERRKQIQVEEKLRVLRKAILDKIFDIRNANECLQSCFKLLVPVPEQFIINEDASIDAAELDEQEKINFSTEENLLSDLNEDDIHCRETGMIHPNYSIEIKLPKGDQLIKIIESEENCPVIENAKENYKLLKNKYLNVTKTWIKDLTKLSDNSRELKKIIDLKNDIEKAVKKYESIKFCKSETASDPEEESSDESDSEMIDVTPHIPSVDEEIMAKFKDADDQLPSISGTSSMPTDTERKKTLLKVAPKLPFDVDLYHWEDEKLSVPMLLPVTAEGRQFWSASRMEDTDGIPIPDGVASLRTRIIEFSGKFEPVKWSCRFPLPSGRLCPRQDRVKCPFHGPIVARDEAGKSVNPEDRKRDEELLNKLVYDEAQSPALLAEIKRTTGVDLKMPDRKRKKKPDDTSIADIKKEKNTAYKRLERKIFNKSTVKKVSRTMDRLDQKRYRDKFGDQFQYVHNTT